ncbi:MAG TPA: P1 family peptidase [Longimicrobium sp.]|jgi:L-aminopeptidase/D-esterase-like protein|uniref:DmpA family aminopeptidase n=1 Tax=Longimicrobium sp. TaxID=2029185 RepID=UPI002ED8488F
MKTIPMRARRTLYLLTLFAASLAAASPADAQERARARDLGIQLPGTPGPLNAITDVAGLQVGHTTLIQGDGRLVRGQGPVRTGVTAILPRGHAGPDSVFAAWFTLNGNGEMTGTTWIQESGVLEGPVLITNTHSVGVVRDATIDWMSRNGRAPIFALPVVAETFDGALNDDLGFHVRPEHVFAALDSARGGRVPEGNVGGGTGMICHQFKGGIGTASRRVTVGDSVYTVGVLVQCNYGGRRPFRVDGVPVGEAITDLRPCMAGGQRASRPWLAGVPACAGDPASAAGDVAPPREGLGSIIVVVATDAPLLPHQLKRMATRVSLGVGRMGGFGENSSGDIFLAFSTANRGASVSEGVGTLRMLSNEEINPFFSATAYATEEAILNAMLAAATMTGADGFRVHALPHDRLVEVMRRHHRIRD